MLCYVYKGRRKEGAYLYLPREDDFADVPDTLLKSLGELSLTLSFELSIDRGLARADAATVLENIEQQGFHFQMPLSHASMLSKLPGAKLSK